LSRKKKTKELKKKKRLRKSRGGDSPRPPHQKKSSRAKNQSDFVGCTGQKGNLLFVKREGKNIFGTKKGRQENCSWRKKAGKQVRRLFGKIRVGAGGRAKITLVGR